MAHTYVTGFHVFGMVVIVITDCVIISKGMAVWFVNSPCHVWDLALPYSRTPQQNQVPLPSSWLWWPQSCMEEMLNTWAWEQHGRWRWGYVFFLQCSPIVRAVCVWDSGVCIICDQPVKALIRVQPNLLPLGADHVAASGVEVSQQNDVLGKWRRNISMSILHKCSLKQTWKRCGLWRIFMSVIK